MFTLAGFWLFILDNFKNKKVFIFFQRIKFNSGHLGGMKLFKKRNIKGLILFVIIALVLVGYSLRTTTSEYPTLITDDYNGLSLDQLNHYKIEVELDPEEKTYEGKQWITYINNTGVDLPEIYIHIYPNVFGRKKTAPFLFDSQIGRAHV